MDTGDCSYLKGKGDLSAFCVVYIEAECIF